MGQWEGFFPRRSESHCATTIIRMWAARRGDLSARNRTMRAGTGERASLAYDARDFIAYILFERSIQASGTRR